MSNGPTEPTPELQAALERGRRVGQVDAALSEHDERLDKINGSMERLANEMGEVKLAVQRLGDDARSAATTVLATAKALKEERDATAEALRARTERADQRWTPAMRFGALAGSAATVLGVAIAVYLALKP